MTAHITPSSPEYALGQNDPAAYPPTLRAVRYLVSFLQWRFSLLPIGSYHWAPEDADQPDRSGSEIYISADTPLPARAFGERPAITVLRSQLVFQGIGIGDTMDHQLTSGAKSYMDLMPTTLCISVVSRLSYVAERLAWFCWEQVFTLREEIIRTEQSILSIGRAVTMTPPAPAGPLVESADTDWIAVALYLPTYLQHTMSFIPINRPVLSGFSVDVKTKG